MERVGQTEKRERENWGGERWNWQKIGKWMFADR